MLRIGLLAVLLASLATRADTKLLPPDLLFTDPEAYAFHLSPDGQYLAGYMNFDGDRSLLLLETASEAQHPLLNISEIKDLYLSEFGWVDADTLFVQFNGRDDHNPLAIIDISVVNGELTRTLDVVPGKGQILDPLPAVEDTVFYARSTDDDAYPMIPYTATTAQLLGGNFRQAQAFGSRLGNAVNYRIDRSSNALFAITREEEGLRHWRLGHNDTKWQPVFSNDPREFSFWIIGTMANGRLSVLTDRNQDTLSLVEFDPVIQQFGELLYGHERYDLLDAALTSDGSSLRSISYYDHGTPVTEYFIESDSRFTALLEKAFPDQHVQIESGDADSRYRVLRVRSSTNPGDYYLFDTDTGEAKFLAPRYSGIAGYELARSEVFTVSGEDGVPIEAILTRAPRPNGVLLVNPHGGPVGVRNVADYDQGTQFLASRGYAVLNVNFRGSWGFGRAFRNEGRGEFGRRIEDDISRVVGDLLARENYDQVCSVGSSYGGYSAMMLAIRQPDLYRCVVAMYGIYDLPFVFNTSNLTLQDEIQQSIEHVVGENSDALRDVSPLYRAEGLRAPVLLIAGSDDDIADYEQSNRMKYRLQQLGKPVEYYFYENVGHGQHHWSGERHQYALLDDFIRRALNLALPEGDNRDEILGQEYHDIAYRYDVSEYADHDDSLVYGFVQKAAALGHPESVRWLGGFHDVGRYVAEDDEQAAVHYRRAAALGNGRAAHRLGELLRDGRVDPATDEPAAAAFAQFEQALELGYGRASYDVADALCRGEGTKPDPDRCLELLRTVAGDGADSSANRRWRNSVVARLAWDETLDDGLHARLRELIREVWESDYRALDLQVTRSGFFESRRVLRDGSVPLANGSRFGVLVRARKWRTDVTNGERFTVKVRWTGPAAARDGEGISDYTLLTIVGFGEWRIYYELKYDWQLVPGDWRLEVETLDGERLVDESFRVGP